LSKSPHSAGANPRPTPVLRRPRCPGRRGAAGDAYCLWGASIRSPVCEHDRLPYGDLCWGDAVARLDPLRRHLPAHRSGAPPVPTSAAAGRRAPGVAAWGPRPPAPGRANRLAPRRPVRPGGAEPAPAARRVERPACPTGDAATLAPGARPAQVGRLRRAPYSVGQRLVIVAASTGFQPLARLRARAISCPAIQTMPACLEEWQDARR